MDGTSVPSLFAGSYSIARNHGLRVRKHELSPTPCSAPERRALCLVFKRTVADFPDTDAISRQGRYHSANGLISAENRLGSPVEVLTGANKACGETRGEGRVT